jgi:hypothetical protein
MALAVLTAHGLVLALGVLPTVHLPRLQPEALEAQRSTCPPLAALAGTGVRQVTPGLQAHKEAAALVVYLAVQSAGTAL